MEDKKDSKTHHRLRFSLRNDVNGLVIVLAVLLALMMLPGPTEAEFKACDILMNDLVKVGDLKLR